MNSETVINPYDLLKVDPYNPDMKRLKKNYYQLALKYHPDKGGSEKAIRIIQNAYNYIKLQFQNCQNVKSYEQLEKEFQSFSEKQTSQPQVKTYQDQYAKRKSFNHEFEQHKAVNTTSFDKGYGELMTHSEYAKGKLTYDKNNIHKKNKHTFKNIDKKALTIYKEPASFLQSYGNHERFDVEKVKDFSYNTNQLSMSDYHKAFKIIGEENIKKVKVKKRTYKKYLKQREIDKKTYKVSNKKKSGYVFKEVEYVPKETYSSTEESSEETSEID